MARRRRKGRGHKTKAIPLAPLLPGALIVMNDYALSAGINKLFVDRLARDLVGVDPVTKKWSFTNIAPFAGGTIAGIIVHKVAAKTVNKYIRKATMGYLVL